MACACRRSASLFFCSFRRREKNPDADRVAGTYFLFVIAGLDPAIHAEKRRAQVFADALREPHGIMDHRVIGKRSDAVLRTAMPGGDEGTGDEPSCGVNRHPRPCGVVKSSFGPFGTTPLGLTMNRLP